MKPELGYFISGRLSSFISGQVFVMKCPSCHGRCGPVTGCLFCLRIWESFEPRNVCVMKIDSPTGLKCLVPVTVMFTLAGNLIGSR